jgi:hypothetical protein
MTLEAALITAVGTLSGVLSYIAKLLWDRVQIVERKADACEEHRNKMQDEIEALKEERGSSSAIMKVVAACPASACPTRALVRPPARYVEKEPIGSQPSFPQTA